VLASPGGKPAGGVTERIETTKEVEKKIRDMTRGRPAGTGGKKRNRPVLGDAGEVNLTLHPLAEAGKEAMRFKGF